MSYCTLLRKMFTNVEYLKILGATAFCYGTEIAFIATLNQCITILGYQNPGRTFAVILFSFSASGIVSTIMFSFILKKTVAYKKISLIRKFILIFSDHGWISDIHLFFSDSLPRFQS